MAVAGASGGLGVSVLVAGIAVRAAAAGACVAAVDLDPLGGGLDVTFGAEQHTGLRWADLAGLDGDADGSALWEELPQSNGVRVLSHSRDEVVPPRPECVGPVVAALHARCDLLVVDLALRNAAWAVVAASADTVVLVAGTQIRQVAALTVVARRLRAEVGTGRDLVVCLRSDREDDELGEFVSGQLGLPVLGVLDHDRRVRSDLVHGIPPGTRRGPVMSVADLVVARALLHEGDGAA